MQDFLVLDAVSKTFSPGAFNETVALRGISLRFQPGECVLIVGPNGSGKSTLLNIIGGYVLPTTGSVCLRGKKLNGIPAYGRAHDMYRLFQDTHNGVIGIATIAENMALARRRGRSPRWTSALVTKEEMEIFRATIREFRPELSDRLDEKAFRLSPGERQALTLALLKLQTADSTAILLADEPTASLDPELADHCRRLIYDYSSRGWLCLVATHDERLMTKHKDRLIEMNRGLVRMDTSNYETLSK